MTELELIRPRWTSLPAASPKSSRATPQLSDERSRRAAPARGSGSGLPRASSVEGLAPPSRREIDQPGFNYLRHAHIYYRPDQIRLPRGGGERDWGMSDGVLDQIEQIIVLMLENRSFVESLEGGRTDVGGLTSGMSGGRSFAETAVSRR